MEQERITFHVDHNPDDWEVEIKDSCYTLIRKKPTTVDDVKSPVILDSLVDGKPPETGTFIHEENKPTSTTVESEERGWFKKSMDDFRMKRIMGTDGGGDFYESYKKYVSEIVDEYEATVFNNPPTVKGEERIVGGRVEAGEPVFSITDYREKQPTVESEERSVFEKQPEWIKKCFDDFLVEWDKQVLDLKDYLWRVQHPPYIGKGLEIKTPAQLLNEVRNSPKTETVEAPKHEGKKTILDGLSHKQIFESGVNAEDLTYEQLLSNDYLILEKSKIVL